MGSLDSYNILMMVNSVQEQSIIELFRKNTWDCQYKVLPSDCNYLWSMCEDTKTEQNCSYHAEIQETEQHTDELKQVNCPKLKNNHFINRDATAAIQNALRKPDGRLRRKQEKEPYCDVVVTAKEKLEVQNTLKKLNDVCGKNTNKVKNENHSDNSDTTACEANHNRMQEKQIPHRTRHANVQKESEIESSLKRSKNNLNLNKNRMHSTCRVEGNEGIHVIQSETGSVKGLKHGELKSCGNRFRDKRKFPDGKVTEEEKSNLKNKTCSVGIRLLTTATEKKNDVPVLPVNNTKVSGLLKRCSSCGRRLYKRKNQTFCKFCQEKCSFCEKTFPKTLTGQKRLEIHLRRHAGQKPFKCCDCNRMFTSQEYLLRHRGRKHNPSPSYVPCTVCSKTFNKAYLRNHMVNMHSDRMTSYQCDLCGNCFRYKGSLTQHRISVHAEERNFTCDICSSSFTSSHNLRLHRVRHEADQKAVCNICGKTLQGGSGFKEHMRRHANQRQYQCGKCTKSFYSKRDLVNHFKIHTGEKPFKCHLCPYACAVKGNLTKHMKRHRSGDVIPDHKYKGHCPVQKIADYIEKVDYKEVNFLAENVNMNDHSVTSETDKELDRTRSAVRHCPKQGIQKPALSSLEINTFLAQGESDSEVKVSRTKTEITTYMSYDGKKDCLLRTNTLSCSSSLETRIDTTSAEFTMESQSAEHMQFVSHNQANASLNPELNNFSNQVVHPSLSANNASYYSHIDVMVPVVYKDNQKLNEGQTNQYQYYK